MCMSMPLVLFPLKSPNILKLHSSLQNFQKSMNTMCEFVNLCGNKIPVKLQTRRPTTLVALFHHRSY